MIKVLTKPTYRKRYLEFKTKYGRIKEAMNSLKLNYDKLKIKYDRKEQRCVTLEKGMEDLRVRFAKCVWCVCPFICSYLNGCYTPPN